MIVVFPAPISGRVFLAAVRTSRTPPRPIGERPARASRRPLARRGRFATRNRVAELREASNLRRRDIAARLGVTVEVVKGWEHGRAVPDRYQLALAEMYGVSVVWLMGAER